MKHKVAVIAAVLLVGLLLLFPTGQKEVAGQSSCPPGQTYEPCFSDRYDDGYCTCYVEKRALQSGLWSYDKLERLGHAGEWNDNAPRNGLKVGIIPYQNSIAVWEAGPGFSVGHVAFVENISRDGKDGFNFSQMNGCNAECLNCVSWGHQNAKEAAAGTLHFIYPPSDRPVQLWPYSELRVEYGSPITLRWYGSFSYYAVYEEYLYADGGIGAGAAWGIQETYHVSGLPRSAKVTWGVCGYDYPGDPNEVCSGQRVFHAVLCPGGGTLARGTERFGPTSDGDYCPPGENPTPIPTSTPFPTPTVAPQPTATSQPTNTPLPSQGELRQASDLHFSPENPRVGEQVHFWFLVRNTGDLPVSFLEMGPWGYGPGHSYWDANRHQGTGLVGGSSITINSYRAFAGAGTWTVRGIHYQLIGDPEPRGYYDLSSDGYAAAGIEIRVVEPIPTLTPQPMDTPTVSPHDTPTTTPTPGGGLNTPTPSLPTPTPATPQPTQTPAPCTPLFEVGDFDCNCVIDVADIMQVASRWQCQEGDECYNEVYDLDDNGIINIVDIMRVSARWGETC